MHKVYLVYGFKRFFNQAVIGVGETVIPAEGQGNMNQPSLTSLSERTSH